MLAMGSAGAAPSDEIRATAVRFVAAQNAHDLTRVNGLLTDSPDFLWINSGTVIRTRDDALRHFGELFQADWRVDPDWSTFHVVMLDVSTAELFLHVSITRGGSSQSTAMNQILVKTPIGWRVMAVITGKA